jgi:Flp pilus assembly protein TadB
MSALAAALTLLTVALALTSVAGGNRRQPANHDRSSGTTTGAGNGELDLVDVIERVAREVHTGHSLRVALDGALAAAPNVLPDLASSIARQVPLARAIEAHQPQGDECDLFVHALRLATEHPHVVPDVLARTTSVIRERRAWRNERRVQAAQARTSARVLTFLPLGFAAWGAASSGSVRHAYATSPATAGVALIGLGLNVVGWWWMRRLVVGPVMNR